MNCKLVITKKYKGTMISILIFIETHCHSLILFIPVAHWLVLYYMLSILKLAARNSKVCVHSTYFDRKLQN